MLNPLYEVETFNARKQMGSTYANGHVSIKSTGVDNTDWFTLAMQLEDCKGINLVGSLWVRFVKQYMVNVYFRGLRWGPFDVVT